MKKVLFVGLMFGLLFILPGKIQAQFYSPYIYNNNALLNRALAHSKAKAAYKRKVSRKKTGKKVVRRKSRRVSSLQINEQKFKLDAYLPKRTEVV